MLSFEQNSFMDNKFTVNPQVRFDFIGLFLQLLKVMHKIRK